ncbi:MAG: hypothetical protein ACYDH6_07360 [Acidimicrobiales bacterium]
MIDDVDDVERPYPALDERDAFDSTVVIDLILDTFSIAEQPFDLGPGDVDLPRLVIDMVTNDPSVAFDPVIGHAGPGQLRWSC